MSSVAKGKAKGNVDLYSASSWNIYKALRSSQYLKSSKKEAGSLPQAEVECPLPRILFIYFWSEGGEFWCILGGILWDLELQESKQETRL